LVASAIVFGEVGHNLGTDVFAAVRTGLFFAAIAAAIAGALDPHFPLGLADYDWAFHLLAFSVLIIAGAWIGWRLLPVFFVVGFTGVLIELAQAMVPTRSFSARDLLLNAFGMGIGLIAVISMRILARRFPGPMAYRRVAGLLRREKKVSLPVL
jgi:hypothetical protein